MMLFNKTPKWEFAEEEQYKEGVLPIRIVSGKYYGIVYKYGIIKPTVLPNGKLNVDIQYVVIENPKKKKINADFTEVAGVILSEMVAMEEKFKANHVEDEYNSATREEDQKKLTPTTSV